MLSPSEWSLRVLQPDRSSGDRKLLIEGQKVIAGIDLRCGDTPSGLPQLPFCRACRAVGRGSALLSPISGYLPSAPGPGRKWSSSTVLLCSVHCLLWESDDPDLIDPVWGQWGARNLPALPTTLRVKPTIIIHHTGIPHRSLTTQSARITKLKYRNRGDARP